MRSIRPVARQNSPNAAPRAAFSRKSSPCTPQNANFGSFFVRWANFFAHTPTIRPAGRTFSRTGHGHVPTLKPITPLQPLMQASMKPPAPLLAPKQRPLKPATPLQPKNAPKTPISRPQRRWRFQLGLSLREQRRWRFQPHAQTSEQRRQGFHARDFRCPRAAAGPGRAPSQRAEPHISDQAPLVWRAPEGPEIVRGPGCGAHVGGGRARAKQKSHIISRGHFLSLSTNVAIATMRIQSLK